MPEVERSMFLMSAAVNGARDLYTPRLRHGMIKHYRDARRHVMRKLLKDKAL
jgi:hypothetical protein